MKLYDKGVYLLNGTELVEDTPEAAAVLKAKTGTYAGTGKDTDDCLQYFKRA